MDLKKFKDKKKGGIFFLKKYIKKILFLFGDQLKRVIKYFSGSSYIEYTEIPEHLRLRDIFFTNLERYYANEAAEFVRTNCMNAYPFTHKHHLLKYALDYSKVDGCILEFGVARGKSINFLASNTSQIVYGFDSFIGLPEDWSGGNRFVPKEYFDFKGQMPLCRPNVKLIKGWFEDTIDDFKKDVNDKIKLIHIDCDLYSSTFYVLESFKDRLIPGSLIVFDEFYNFHGWRNHEYKALMDFKNKYNIKFTYEGFTDRRMLIKIT